MQSIDEVTTKIKMGAVYEEDLVANLRERMIKTVDVLADSKEPFFSLNNENALIQQLGGSREFVL